MKKYALCFLAFLVWTVSPAEAGDVTLFGGFHHPGALTLGSVGTLPGTAAQITDPKDFGVFGVRFNSSATFLGFENSFAYSPNFIDSDAWAVLQSSNLIIGVPALPVRPYGSAGIGFVHAGGEGPAAFGSKFAFNYGGGVKVSGLGPLGLRFDVRGYSIPAVESQTVKILETTVGLLISF
jgi:hypothetical protein